MMAELSHFDNQGASRMVDVGAKSPTQRVARASGLVCMEQSTRQLILDTNRGKGGHTKGHTKGDVLEVARLAGIMATKRTAELIPLCHPLGLESVQLELRGEGTNRIRIEATTTVTAKTGVEMEALTAVSVAALTIYDMCKAVDRSMVIERIQLEEKLGGNSGHFRRSES